MNILAAGFGDYLIPLLIVGWMIYSIVKKFGAERAAPGPDSSEAPETEKQGSVRTLLEEILLGEEFVQRPVSPNAAQTTTQQESSPAVLATAPEPAPFLTNEIQLYKGGEMEENAQPEALVSVASTLEDHPESFLSDFDLRKAFLWSEILKRPFP